ncbi:PREDICTED: SH3 domain-containing protein C23A1.17-like [Cyphomyrmex costatus]|uniref:SH3 domain-containing protein C23A1.17-like n=1 Tax=Cyphomyrmex costatus TaxID=456900 RepID=UPI0008523B36|nr:PREDICTED: SH3 domain-containing protein C23A1.17-like [Cyphomyrmex costatus]
MTDSQSDDFLLMDVVEPIEELMALRAENKKLKKIVAQSSGPPQAVETAIPAATQPPIPGPSQPPDPEPAATQPPIPGPSQPPAPEPAATQPPIPGPSQPPAPEPAATQPPAPGPAATQSPAQGPAAVQPLAVLQEKPQCSELVAHFGPISEATPTVSPLSRQLFTLCLRS